MRSISRSGLSQHLEHLFRPEADGYLIYGHLPAFGKYAGLNIVEDLTEFALELANIGKMVFFPTYSLWDGDIHRGRTSSGVLSQHLLNEGIGVRSKSILHSHVGIGPIPDDFLSKPTSSREVQSDFPFLLGLKLNLVGLGCGLDKAGTVIHQAETDLQVPYREWKLLQKNVVFADGSVETNEVRYFARVDDRIRENFTGLEGVAEARGLLRRFPAPYSSSIVAPLRDIYSTATNMIGDNPFSVVSWT